MSDRSRAVSVESVLGAIGACVVVAVLSFLAFEAVVADGRGPALSTSVVGTEASGSEHVVHFEVRNDGSRTAEQVRVVGELMKGGQAVEQVSSSIAYVPMGSSRRGVLVFERAPTAPEELRVRAVSYTTP